MLLGPDCLLKVSRFVFKMCFNIWITKKEQKMWFLFYLIWPQAVILSAHRLCWGLSNTFSPCGRCISVAWLSLSSVTISQIRPQQIQACSAALPCAASLRTIKYGRPLCVCVCLWRGYQGRYLAFFIRLYLSLLQTEKCATLALVQRPLTQQYLIGNTSTSSGRHDAPGETWS